MASSSSQTGAASGVSGGAARGASSSTSNTKKPSDDRSMKIKLSDAANDVSLLACSTLKGARNVAEKGRSIGRDIKGRFK